MPRNNLEQPLVSILIPTHNRPQMFEVALKSAIAQTYLNIEIIISDNSDDDITQSLIKSYLDNHKNIIYIRCQGVSAGQNFLNCLEHSLGEYINILFDDDVFMPEKIERMLHYYLAYPEIGFVTSSRQVIDQEGSILPPKTTTKALFQQDTRIGGRSLGEFILSEGRNVVGEPTTVLLRRSDIPNGFGMFCKHQFIVLSDVATWLSILAYKDCVYISEPLSQFRLHAGQDQNNGETIIKSQIEWMRLLCEGHRNGIFLLDRTALQEVFPAKFATFMSYLGTHHRDIREGSFDIRAIQETVKQAIELLLIK